MVFSGADPISHYDTTAAEIIEAIEASHASDGSSRLHPSSGRVDLLVAGAGTGGTISGIAKRLKEHDPQTKVLGVDPIGSVLARPATLNVLPEGSNGLYAVEGVGYDFVRPLQSSFRTGTNSDLFI
jgi:cystathionine beta-synthase